MRKPPMPGRTNSTCRMSNISATATSRCWRGCSSRAATGRSRRSSICTAAPVPVEPAVGQDAPRDFGGPWQRRGVARLAMRQRGRLSEGAPGHQLRDPLGQGTRQRPEDHARMVAISGQSSGGHLAMLAAMRPNDPRYTTIALPAGSPKVDATVKCAIYVLARDQSDRPLQLRQAASRVNGGVGAGHHLAPQSVLGQRGQHDRGEPDADARARREGPRCRRRSGIRAWAT